MKWNFVRKILPYLAESFLGLLLVGCSRSVAQPPPPAPTVTVAQVEQRELVEWEEFTGRTEPVETVEVRPRVSGYIKSVHFKAGQSVKKGDVLFTIDPRWHQADFEKRTAEFEQARVHLENAKREADRTTKLLADRAISTEDSDARQARFAEAKAAMLAARAALDSTKLDLEHTEVRAPINGKVSRALLTEGNFASGIAGAGSLLATLVTVDPIYVYVDVDENSFLKFNALAQANTLQTNQDGRIPVNLELADEKEFPHHGHIESWDNRLDANTGSILLRAVFPNPDGRVVAGLFARIRVPLSERHQVLLVEERALGTDQDQKFVFTLTPTNTVQYRAVKLGPALEGKRIVRSGLDSTDKVVVNGVQRVHPGSVVDPQTEGPTNSATVARITQH